MHGPRHRAVARLAAVGRRSRRRRSNRPRGASVVVVHPRGCVRRCGPGYVRFARHRLRVSPGGGHHAPRCTRCGGRHRRGPARSPHHELGIGQCPIRSSSPRWLARGGAGRVIRRSQRILVVLAVVILGACSNGDNEGSGSSTTENGGSSTASTSASTSTSLRSKTTEPPATDIAAVTPVLQALINRYDAAVAAILVDPRVAVDRSNPPVRAYLELLTSASGLADTALEFWISEGAQGRFYRAGPRGQMYASTIQSVAADSPDQATFVVCSLRSISIVDASGVELSAEGGQSAGSVVAVRSDGAWLIRDLTRTSPATCPAPSSEP